MNNRIWKVTFSDAHYRFIIAENIQQVIDNFSSDIDIFSSIERICDELQIEKLNERY